MIRLFIRHQNLALLCILLVFLTNQAIAQQTLREGAPDKRREFEMNMLKNPKTGKIPDNIREKELIYVYTTPSLKKSTGKTIGKKGKGAATIQASTWNLRGPYNVGGRTRALAIDRTDENIILAGGVSGGMWRSIDGGANWTQTTGSSQLKSVMDVYQDPLNTNIWYYVTGEIVGNSARGGGGAFYRGDGVFKSIDGGVTWVSMANTTADPTVFTGGLQYSMRVRVDPTNSDVYIAAYDGIYRSTNQGVDFTNVLSAPGAEYTDIEISATGVIYATISSQSTSSNEGVFTSTNGTSWTDISPTGLTSSASYLRVVLDIAPSNENILYVFANTPGEGTNDHKIFYTSDAGTNWTERSGNLPAFGGSVGNLAQGSYNQLIKIKPDDPNTVFIGSTNLYRSTDGFATNGNNAWIGGYSPDNDVSRYENHHPDNHAIVFYASDAKKMLSGHDGGISLTTDNTTTNAGTFPVAWTSLNNGYYTTQAYAVGIDPETSGDPRIIAGFQDNGKYTTTSTSATTNWFEEGGGGDGTYVAIVAGEDIRYVGTQNGSVRRYKGPNIESALTFDYINPISASGELFVNPYVLDQNDQNIMYHAGGNFVWRNTNLEGIINKSNPSGSLTNWEVITGTFTGGNSVTALDVSKYDKANVLYYGTSGGDLFRYDDANTVLTTAVNITDASFPSGAYVSCVAVDPYNSANVIVVFSNYQVKSVFYSTDSGASWTDISGNLEQNADGSGNGPSVRWAEIHRDANGLPVYLVGTSTGLYSTETLNGTSTTWAQEGSTTIGNVPVTMIVGRSIDNLVAVGTHGVGIFSASVTAASPTCNGATNLAASNITETTATLSWTAVGGATSYDVRYQVRGSGVWTNVAGITATNTNLTGLTTNTNYQFQVRVNCGAGTGEYVSSFFSSKLACTTTFPYLESFESGFGNWTQDKTDDFEWDLNNTSTFTSATGPSGANDGSVYAFIESSGTNNPTKTARLVSNCFDLSGLSEPKFSFDYHMYGANLGTLSLEVSTDDGSNWTSIWSQTGDLGDTWFSQELDISAYQTSSTQFRFVGVTGSSFRSDMAIDKIQIYATPSNEKGNYLSLDGTNQYVSTGSNLSTATDNFTMELWFQRSGSGSGDKILFYNGSTAANNGYGLVLDNSNYVVPMIDGTAITNTTTLIDANKWYHAALVRESGTLKLYINGLEQTLGSSAAPNTPTVATYLGGNNGGSNAFSGFLEEARFWSVARTMAQVRENMHLVVEGTTSGLVSYYQFNETQVGVDVSDAAGGNNGTLQNAPTRVSSDCPIGKGRSQTISVTTGGVKDFSTTGLQLEFPGSGTYPGDNVVVTQIDGIGAPTNIPSDVKTHPSSYWVIHNYGTNATFTELLGVTMTLPNNDVISADDEATPANIKIYKRSSSAGNSENWTEIGSATSATVATRTLVFNTFTPDFDSFSQLMAGATNTATSGLPVTLSRFEAIRQSETQVQLNWETISEINSQKFQILKSDNGVDFSIIGEQDAAGNSTQTRRYTFVDSDALRSAYYRLKQIDRNGTYTLSNIKFVEGKDLQGVQFFPNPFANELKIDFGSNPTTLPIRLEVYSAKGSQIINIQGNSGNLPQYLARQTQALPKGVYIVKMVVGNKLYTKQVVKQ